MGGILNQCIHSGFGLHTFREELTGPEYAARYIEKVKGENILWRVNATVISVSRQREVCYVSPEDGLVVLGAKAIVLAMGCRERPRGALNIPGGRPAGIYSAGTAQRLINIEGARVGREAVILGSGDIGLIMARRLTLEGMKVKAVAELMPYSAGLKRNIVQCLEDFGIPLMLSHTVVRIHGNKRVTGVTLAQVDDKLHPIPGTEREVSCDTLLLSVGLLPENELTRGMGAEISSGTGGPVVNNHLETDVEGVFACGNVLHVHDLVDYVSQEADLAGMFAAQFAMNGRISSERCIEVKTGNGVRYTVPQFFDLDNLNENELLRFRVTQVFKNCNVKVEINGRRVVSKHKRIMVPGEMEQLILQKGIFQENLEIREIKISVEEQQ